MIAVAGASLAAAFALRLAVEASDLEVLLFCVLPIAILAAEFGLAGGLAGAAGAAAVLSLAIAATDPEIDAWQLAGRTARFALLALLVAGLAETLRRLTLVRADVVRQRAERAEAEQQRAQIARLADDRERLAQDLITAEDEARRRIAEDLHDGPLQTLLAAKQDLVEASPGRAKVQQAADEVSAGIEALRHAVGALHPATIERGDLECALRALAADAETRGGFRCQPRIEPGAGGPQDQVIVSLARELLANAAKHSNAGEVRMAVRRDRNWVRLEVSDDGRGFDPAARRVAPSNGHIGLACVEERVRALGGDLAIAAGPGGGTAIAIRLPAGPPAVARVGGPSRHGRG